MRATLVPLAILLTMQPISAQLASPPPDLAVLEIERSRECVEVLAQVEALDAELEPLARRIERLIAVAEAVALEDDRILDALNLDDPVEAQVEAWFRRDQELAQRYVATLAQSLVQERTAARDSIKTVVTEAVAQIQVQANDKIEATGDLPQRAGPCDGAIMVRPVVLEACAERSGRLCDAARAEPGQSPFRFVDQPEAVWDIQQVRPWTDPGPLRVTPEGQLDGARTIAYARIGNVVVSVAFSPILQDRAALTPEALQQFQTTNEALGIQFDHPELAFAPGLAIRATLPKPLGGEQSYALHFGQAEAPDVLWTGEAGTGAPLEATVQLSPVQVGKLQAGEPITLTALPADGAGTGGEPVFAIELAAVNQTRATTALLGYMAGRMGQDLTNLLRPRGG